MKKIERVGMIGLGKMGLPMAGHLLAKGFAVIGCDPVPDACAAARKLGVEIVATPAAVAAATDLSIVGFDHEVEIVALGKDGIASGAAPGHVMAVGSTISPQAAKAIAARLAERGIVALDAPLTRGEAAATAGKLLILGAGDDAAFEACRPAFATFASDIHHLGSAPGAGQVGKMVNNLILWACTAANDEGLRLGEALGVPADRMRKALHDSSAQNWAMDQRADLSGMPWAEKDMMIVLAEADRERLSLPLCGTVKEVIKGLKIRMGLGMPKARS
jgi:3-hydroxyisobutyrate dehydrogenase-like beta-hydroxyacid dehydrogenase